MRESTAKFFYRYFFCQQAKVPKLFLARVKRGSCV
jgi:hypothetical protein